MKKVLARFVMNTTLLRMAFCRNIIVGSVYHLDDKDRKNPFKMSAKARVLDVKNGYVYYEMTPRAIMRSRKITSFLIFYALDV